MRKKAGTGVPQIVATLRTIGAAMATAASESERDQPPSPETLYRYSLDRPADQNAANERVHTDGKPERGWRVLCPDARGYSENYDRENDSADTLPDPERMIGHSLCAGELRRACRGIEESPMSAYCALKRTLPRLVERFDNVDVEFLALA